VLAAAVGRLEAQGLWVIRTAPVITTDPIGPSIRRYANSAVLVETRLAPDAMLHLVKRTEREFGRRAGGQRWTARVLDLDIVLWSGGPFAAPDLTIPHPLFRERAFVLDPAVRIAAGWRDPVTSLTVHQLHARLTRPRAGHR
jgi:2-amino-4-hydroxy-6-hydroxymethyldihydropteridine diphosphokinase